jgi:hypothetical protein
MNRVDLTLSSVASPASFAECWTDEVFRLYCLSDPRGDAPFPTSPWFGPLTNYLAGNDVFPVDISHPVAHIQRSFDLGPLRLADYVEIK